MDTFNLVRQNIQKEAPQSTAEILAIMDRYGLSNQEKLRLLKEFELPQAALGSTPTELNLVKARQELTPAPITTPPPPTFSDKIASGKLVATRPSVITTADKAAPAGTIDLRQDFTAAPPPPPAAAAPAPAPVSAAPTSQTSSSSSSAAIKATMPVSPKDAQKKEFVVRDLSNQIRLDNSIPSEVKEAFESRLKDLQTQLSEVRKEYSGKWDAAQKDFEDAKTRTEWQQLAESFGNAFVQIGAAYYGLQQTKASGLPINLGNLNLRVTDWDKKVDRSLSELQQKRISIGEAQKEAVSGITAEMGEIGKTSRELMQQAGQDARAEAGLRQRSAEAAENRRLQAYLAGERNRLQEMSLEMRQRMADNKLNPNDYKRIKDFNDAYGSVTRDISTGTVKDKKGLVERIAGLMTMAGMPQDQIAQAIDEQKGLLWGNNPEEMLPLLREAANRINRRYNFPLIEEDGAEGELDPFELD
jgi:hypothetical protein